MQTVIAIDLGGTKVSAALIDRQGSLLWRIQQPTDNAGAKAILQQLAALVAALSERASGTVVAVGVGTPGFVDSGQGRVLLATNLPGWGGTSVRDQLQELCGLPVVVENDANAAAVGEAWQGAGRNRESFVMLTLGTGVGGAIYHRQWGLWPGASFRSGELGHAILYPGGRPCPCGQRGCVDQYLSGRALQQSYQRLTGQVATSEQLVRLAKQGETAALQTLNQFATDLAVLLTSLQNLLDPEVFLLGGGVAATWDSWWPYLQAHLQQTAMPGCPIQVVPASAGADAGLLGMAKLAWELGGGEPRCCKR